MQIGDVPNIAGGRGAIGCIDGIEGDDVTGKRLLIIDDEENMLHMLQAMLSRYDYVIETAQDGLVASGLLEERRFDCILCDIRMPNMDGLAFLRHNETKLIDTTVIMMSAYGSIDLALEAMKAGAYDFISKPFKSDEVLLTLKKAEEREQLKQENLHLKKELQGRSDGFDAIVGTSKAIQESVALAEKVAPYSTTVLITGQSGTGKELIARGIHAASPRRELPFCAINCGSIPAELLESELFGYVKGAFTGAERDKKGLFEEADRGTLFLDEVGELPAAMQVKLLRVLQENEIRPLGASGVVGVDVRIVAATAKDLREEVQKGVFREDLLYRLNVLAIHLPALADRRDDIAMLCEHFVDKYTSSLKSPVTGLSRGAMDVLLRHDWPGNIRELENVIQRGMVLADGDTIELEHISASLVASSNGQNDSSIGIGIQGFSIKHAQKQLEAELIAKALLETGGNKSKAAVLLEISYPSLLSKIKEYDL